jgi:hypothetical protein
LILKPYPLSYKDQAISYLFKETDIQFLILNSCWEIDEYHQDNSSIHPDALTQGLITSHKQIKDLEMKGSSVLRLGVWHHPVTGNDKITDDAFMEQLRKADVKMVMHGHVHEERAELLNYQHSKAIHIAGTGSFGAPMGDRPEATPRMYNLVEVSRDHKTITVNTRCRDKQNGAWKGWNNWPSDDTKSGRSFYSIKF